MRKTLIIAKKGGEKTKNKKNKKKTAMREPPPTSWHTEKNRNQRTRLLGFGPPSTAAQTNRTTAKKREDPSFE
jgi:hypothetical protein